MSPCGGTVDTPRLDRGACNGRGGSTPSKGTILKEGESMEWPHGGTGRRAGLKTRFFGVKVRLLLGLPLFLLSCSHRVPGVTETYLNGCESIDTTPDNNEEWSAKCYCTETDPEFGDCINDWADWNKHN